MSLRVEVCLALPDRQWLVELTLPAGATAAQAVSASGLPERLPAEVATDQMTVGVWNVVVEAPERHVLQDGDRVELYRPLRIDPKLARQARARQARLKAASPAP